MFIKFSQTGKLSVDDIIFEAQYPIIFTCINEHFQKYICICYQSDNTTRQWLITQIEDKVLEDFISDKIPMRHVYTESRPIYRVIFNKLSLAYSIKEVPLKELEQGNDLPKYGQYLDI